MFELNILIFFTGALAAINNIESFFLIILFNLLTCDSFSKFIFFLGNKQNFSYFFFKFFSIPDEIKPPEPIINILVFSIRSNQ